jgi:cytoskeleton protein RodZ
MAALDPDRPSAADGEKALQPTVADGADTAATPATRPAGVEAGPDGARKTDSMAAAGVAEQDPPSAVPAPGETRLVLRFNADCWTDIRDRAGKRLIYRTVLSGQTLVVDGAAPLRVFFGYAPGVEMTVDGEPLDFSAHVRGGVFARFDIAGAN